MDTSDSIATDLVTGIVNSTAEVVYDSLIELADVCTDAIAANCSLPVCSPCPRCVLEHDSNGSTVEGLLYGLGVAALNWLVNAALLAYKRIFHQCDPVNTIV